MKTIKNNPHLLIISKEEYEKQLKISFEKGKAQGREIAYAKEKQAQHGKNREKLKLDSEELDFRSAISEVSNDKSEQNTD